MRYLKWVSTVLLCCMLAYLLCSAQAADETGGIHPVYHQYLTLRAQKLLVLGEYDSWPIEERAALDAVLLDGGYIDVKDGNSFWNSLPQEGEIGKDEALSFAKSYIAQKEGTEASAYAGWVADYRFFRFYHEAEDEVQPEWILNVYPAETTNKQYDQFNVAFSAVDGELRHVSKQTIDTRFPDFAPDVLPAAGQLSEEEALRLSAPEFEALRAATPGLTPEIFEAFIPNASFIEGIYVDDGRDQWLIHRSSHDDVLTEVFKTFEVILDATTGEVVGAGDGGNG